LGVTRMREIEIVGLGVASLVGLGYLKSYLLKGAI
jgi:hypothetical protein